MSDNKKLLSLLKKVTIFSGIDNKSLKQIYSKCDIVKKRKGDVIIEEGTDATEIFILLKGSVKIALDIEKDPIEIVDLGPGSCIGEASVIGIQKHCASVILIEDSELLVLSRELLMDIYSQDKELFSLLILNIARELARRLYQTDQALLKYTSHS